MKNLFLVLFFLPMLASAQLVNHDGMNRSPTTPNITLQSASIPAFATTSATASAAVVDTVTFSSLTDASGAISAVSGFEYSIDGTTSWQSSFSGLPSGIYLLYVRLSAAAASGTYGPSNISVTANGAASRTISVQGTIGAMPVAQFNFSMDAQPVAGWNNIHGNPGAGLSVTDSSTGIVLSTLIGPWDVFAGHVYASNSDGASSGTFSSLFPAAAMAGTFVNIVTYSSGNYGFQVTGLSSGTWEVDLMGSEKSSVIPSGPVDYHCKIGSGSDVQRTLNIQDNSQFYSTWTGTIAAGQTIQFGIYQPASGTPAFGIANAVVIKKLSN